MMNAGGPETHLRHFETIALFAKQVRPADADIIECEFAGRRDMILAAHPSQRAHKAHARRVHRHDEAGMTAGPTGFRIGDAENDQKAAARMSSAGDEPLATIDNVVVAVANH